MKEEIKSLYVKRSQKDYSMSFKLSVVREVEQGGMVICAVARKYGIQSEMTVIRWLRKYGNFDQDNTIGATMVKSPQQRIFELEQKVRLLERQNKFLEQPTVESTHKAGILDKIAEADFNIQIRKNGFPGSRTVLQREPKSDKFSLPIGRDKQTAILPSRVAHTKQTACCCPGYGNGFAGAPSNASYRRQETLLSTSRTVMHTGCR